MLYYIIIQYYTYSYLYRSCFMGVCLNARPWVYILSFPLGDLRPRQTGAQDLLRVFVGPLHVMHAYDVPTHYDDYKHRCGSVVRHHSQNNLPGALDANLLYLHATTPKSCTARTPSNMAGRIPFGPDSSRSWPYAMLGLLGTQAKKWPQRPLAKCHQESAHAPWSSATRTPNWRG